MVKMKDADDKEIERAILIKTDKPIDKTWRHQSVPAEVRRKSIYMWNDIPAKTNMVNLPTKDDINSKIPNPPKIQKVAPNRKYNPLGKGTTLNKILESDKESSMSQSEREPKKSESPNKKDKGKSKDKDKKAKKGSKASSFNTDSLDSGNNSFSTIGDEETKKDVKPTPAIAALKNLFDQRQQQNPKSDPKQFDINSFLKPKTPKNVVESRENFEPMQEEIKMAKGSNKKDKPENSKNKASPSPSKAKGPKKEKQSKYPNRDPMSIQDKKDPEKFENPFAYERNEHERPTKAVSFAPHMKSLL